MRFATHVSVFGHPYTITSIAAATLDVTLPATIISGMIQMPVILCHHV